MTSEKHYHFRQMVMYALADEVLANKMASAFAEVAERR